MKLRYAGHVSIHLFSSLIFFMVFFAGPVRAESPNVKTTSPPNQQIEEEALTNQTMPLKTYLKGYLFDTKAILSAPVRWDATDWFVAGAVVSVAAGLYAYDQDLKDWAQAHRNSTTNNITRFVKPFGDGFYTVPALGLFYAYGYTVDDAKPRKTAMLAVESFMLSGVFTQTLKHATHRQRPSDGPKYDHWDGPSLSGENLSFASGETTAAFSVATVIASEYNDTVYVPVIAYGIATLVGLGRINDNGHWASDVFVGAAIGYFTSRFLTSIHSNANFAVLPLLEDDQKGVSMVYHF